MKKVKDMQASFRSSQYEGKFGLNWKCIGCVVSFLWDDPLKYRNAHVGDWEKVALPLTLLCQCGSCGKKTVRIIAHKWNGSVSESVQTEQIFASGGQPYQANLTLVCSASLKTLYSSLPSVCVQSNYFLLRFPMWCALVIRICCNTFYNIYRWV